MSALVIVGIVIGLLGWLFYWLNTNSPMQTPLPLILWPISIVCLCVAFGMWLA